MKIDVVFSFRNEEENLKELIVRTDSVFSKLVGIEYELIFVNDDSNDGSRDLLYKLNKDYPITIINMSRRFGVGPCTLAGFEYSNGDALIYMDSDLQDPPELIPKLINKFEEGNDIVHTTRIRRDGESKLRMWLTKNAYKIINILSEIKLPLNSGDFKLISKRAVNEICSIGEYDPYVRGLSIFVGFKQDYVMYSREKRFLGKSHFKTFGSGMIKEFLRGITSFSALPLYISFVFGLIIILFGIGLIIYSLLIKFMGIAAPGASSILISLSIFNGSILLSNGVIGLYLAKIYYQVKGRKKYIIESISSAK